MKSETGRETVRDTYLAVDVRVQRRGDVELVKDALERCREVGRLRVMADGRLTQRHVLYPHRLRLD